MSWGNCVVSGDIATLDCIPVVMSNIVTALFIFVGIFCLVLIIGSGYKYINSGGDPKKLDSARNTLIHAIAGLLLVMFALFITNLIADITGVDCIRRFGLGC